MKFVCYNVVMKIVKETQKNKEKCIVIVVLASKLDDKERKLDEITRLCESTELEVVGSFYQNIKEFNKATVLGMGKLQEIKKYIEECEEEIGLAVVDYSLSGSQMRNISEALGVRVIDRVGVIIDIFALRAKTAEAKLQVKYAQDKYLLPRIGDIKGTSGRFGGGVGMRGPGETKLELDRRRLENEMVLLKKQIQEIKKKREVNRREREKTGVKKVAIVGYTNAGKSTLLNALTKENIYAEDKYFATLDTTSRRLFLDFGKQVIITDTVGFITDLPHQLVDAFASTLEEAKEADLILHVVDPTQTGKDGGKYYKKNIEVTNKVLDEIGCKSERIVVFNKCDLISSEEKIDENVILVSAKNKIGLEKLKEIISKKLF